MLHYGSSSFPVVPIKTGPEQIWWRRCRIEQDDSESIERAYIVRLICDPPRRQARQQIERQIYKTTFFSFQ